MLFWTAPIWASLYFQEAFRNNLEQSMSYVQFIRRSGCPSGSGPSTALKDWGVCGRGVHWHLVVQQQSKHQEDWVSRTLMQFLALAERASIPLQWCVCEARPYYNWYLAKQAIKIIISLDKALSFFARRRSECATELARKMGTFPMNEEKLAVWPRVSKWNVQQGSLSLTSQKVLRLF